MRLVILSIFDENSPVIVFKISDEYSILKQSNYFWFNLNIRVVAAKTANQSCHVYSKRLDYASANNTTTVFVVCR